MAHDLKSLSNNIILQDIQNLECVNPIDCIRIQPDKVEQLVILHAGKFFHMDNFYMMKFQDSPNNNQMDTASVIDL